MSDDILKDLNPEQREAATHPKGPLLIVAGAGTGKTTVITRRIAWLILEQKIKADEILALTFTNKAAEEMEERVDKLLPYGYVDLWISTFHGFCQRVLVEHALDIGLPNDIELLDQTGQWLLLREHWDKLELDYYRPSHNPTKFIRELLRHFSKLKDEEITPEDYLRYAEGLKMSLDDMEASGGKAGKRKNDALQTLTPPSPLEGEGTPADEIKRINEVANAYHVYQQLLLANDKMDFGDLINYTLKLFRERPDILKKYQRQFRHVLVDEFQDTNWAQYDLVKMLSAAHNNLAVVADDDQSIYRFRGASTSNVIMFSRDYPEAKRVSLVRNYRSGRQILDLAYNFIQLNNPNRLEASPELAIDKKLQSQTKEPAQIERLHCQTGVDEARIVAETILEIKKRDKEATWNDFAVLVRANSQAREFEQALSAAGIPHRNFSSAGLYKTRIIADILAFFDVLCDYHEGRAIFRLLNLPFLDITMEDIVKMTHWADRKRVSLYNVLSQPQAAGIANETSLAEIARLRDWIQSFQGKAKQSRPTEILHEWLSADNGYLQYLGTLPDADGLEQFRLLRAFWDHLLAIESGLADGRVKGALAVIREEQQSGEQGDMPVDMESGPEMAKIMTVHAAKGLEFAYVFIVNLVDRRFPSSERHNGIAIPDVLVKEIVPAGDVHLQEERRLFYVAMTRAKRALFLTSAENYGGATTKKLSRFLIELGQTSPWFKESAAALSVSARDFLPKKMVASKRDIVLPIPGKFSFTQLRIYSENPFAYKLQFIYKVPALGKAVFSYGSTIHAALQKFFQLIMERSGSAQADLFGGLSHDTTTNPFLNQVQDRLLERRGLEKSPPARGGVGGVGEIPVSLDELTAIYEECWIDDWYESEQDKIKMRKQGRARLKQFYEHLSASGNTPGIKALERPFNLKVGRYTIVGRMDRVDQLPDGTVRIIDYKTGNMFNKVNKNGTLAKKEDKYQLLIYQMASEEVFRETVSQLAYHYIDAENVKSGENFVSFLGNEQDKKEVRDWILEQIKGIEAGRFPLSDNAPFPWPEVEYLRDLAESGEL